MFWPRIAPFALAAISLSILSLRGTEKAPSEIAERAAALGKGIDWEEAREFWAFQKPQAQDLPPVVDVDWPRSRIDYFVLAKLESEGLRPSEEASKRTLIRRVSYALTGLPPSPEAVDAFLRDSSPLAYENLVDRLIDSPAYGERFASLWMNAARYAEDQAHQVGNNVQHFYPNAYRYRKWLIDALNQDMPYDRFVELQLAADKLENPIVDDLPALGFIGLGPKYYNRKRLDVQADEWEDRVDTVSRTFLGLTVACARCHDHKYDPIPTEDYYSLAGVFASTKLINKIPDSIGEPLKSAAANDESEDKKQDDKTISPHALHIVEDGETQNLHVFLRGDVESKGPQVERGFLQILSDDDDYRFESGDSGRLELARRIVDPENPLTARVMVNRIWGAIFGKALVRTPSNFGKLGELPTHPELLDDLAVRFVDRDWSLKELVREMALSATYRQSSMARPELDKVDPENRSLGRMNRNRLTAEMLRDTLLYASKELEPGEGPSRELSDPENRRRTVYGRVSRKQLDTYLALFDYPDPNVHSGKRAETSTPMQKLFVLNSPFMMQRARALAERLLSEGHGSQEARVQRIYGLLYGRSAESREIALALNYLGDSPEISESKWADYAQALALTNELMYLD